MRILERQQLIEEARDVLAKTGFYISEYNDSRLICFDVVARRDNLLIILKLLKNVDSFSKRNALELSLLSEMLKGSPLLIGERTSLNRIESGIVYFRHGIPLINFNTFHDYLIEGLPPFIFSAPGGFYVTIDGEVLRETREARKLSRGLLAKKAGVSIKAIQMYENGMNAMIEAALRLENFLDQPLVRAMDPFSLELKFDQNDNDLEFSSPTEHEIFKQLQEIGYNVVPIAHCPFDALTEHRKVLIITGVSDKVKNTIEKARVMTNLSKITERLSVLFIEKRLRKDNLEGTPVIHKDELKKMDNSEDIIALITERSSE